MKNRHLLLSILQRRKYDIKPNPTALGVSYEDLEIGRIDYMISEIRKSLKTNNGCVILHDNELKDVE
jgi:hypothetical protein